MKRSEKTEILTPICDICGSEVGDFQLERDWKECKYHFCIDHYYIGCAVRDLESQYIHEENYGKSMRKLIDILVQNAMILLKT